MTTMDYTTTLRAMRTLKVQTGSLMCLGCPFKDGCSVHGCVILRNAVEHMEAALANYDNMSALVDQQAADLKACNEYLADSEEARSDLARRLAAARKQVDELTSAQAVMVKQFDEKLEELAQVKAERDAAYRRLGGEPPNTCKTCDLWGKDGWSQHEIGYCEGDDHPHGPDDFCSRHCQQKEA